MLRAITVDDELQNLLLLKRFVEETGQAEVVAQFTDPLSLLEKVGEINPDVIFMDIEMPVMSGLELAEKVVPICKDVQIVFVTAYSHYAIDAFRVNAVDYLLKPIDPKEMNRVIHKLIDSSPLNVIPVMMEASALENQSQSPCRSDFKEMEA